MKRNVIGWSLLIIWVLAACTSMSVVIEEQMTPQVTVVSGKNSSGQSENTSEARIPLDALVTDENGQHLYEVAYGEGWESGIRAEEIPAGEYWIEEGSIVTTRGTSQYIQYASKIIVPGELVQIVHLYGGEKSEYLIVAPENASISAQVNESISILEQSENLLLISMTGKQPYMEETVRNELSISEECSIYSLSDVKEFFENIPLFAAILVILLIFIIIWSYSWSLDLKENRILLFVNAGIGILLFIVLRQVLGALHLPSSLLPCENIFTIQHYSHEFSEIFGALDELSGTVSMEIWEMFMKNIVLACVVIGIGIAGCLGIIVKEHGRR